jgi:hypothetical protein
MNLIDSSGKPRWGRFSTLPSGIDWQGYDARNHMGGRRAPWIKRFLFKHFDFYGVVGQGFEFGCGMVRLGLVNSTFAYVHSEDTGLHRVQFDLPLDVGFQSDYKPLGQTQWVHPFKREHRVTSVRTEHGRALQFQFGDSFHGAIEMNCSDADTLAMNTPVSNTGFAYAQKTSGGPVSGHVCSDGRVFDVNPDMDGSYHDWTAGYLRRDTFWNWACASGRVSPTEPMLSVNLARGVNETSAHENVLWVDGRLFELPLVWFEYDRDQVMNRWRVFSSCGSVDLQFTPHGHVSDHRNLLVLASRFNQCFGVFSGTVRAVGSNQVHRIDGLKGWCEDHYARW